MENYIFPTHDISKMLWPRPCIIIFVLLKRYILELKCLFWHVYNNTSGLKILKSKLSETSLLRFVNPKNIYLTVNILNV